MTPVKLSEVRDQHCVTCGKYVGTTLSYSRQPIFCGDIECFIMEPIDPTYADLADFVIYLMDFFGWPTTKVARWTKGIMSRNSARSIVLTRNQRAERQAKRLNRR